MAAGYRHATTGSPSIPDVVVNAAANQGFSSNTYNENGPLHAQKSRGDDRDMPADEHDVDGSEPEEDSDDPP